MFNSSGFTAKLVNFFRYLKVSLYVSKNFLKISAATGPVADVDGSSGAVKLCRLAGIAQ